jgi:hypothetical protein
LIRVSGATGMQTPLTFVDLNGPPAFAAPSGLAISSDGTTVYVADPEALGGSIYALSLLTPPASWSRTRIRSLGGVTGVVIDETGDLQSDSNAAGFVYAVSPSQTKVWFFDPNQPSGATEIASGSALTTPRALSIVPHIASSPLAGSGLSDLVISDPGDQVPGDGQLLLLRFLGPNASDWNPPDALVADLYEPYAVTIVPPLTTVPACSDGVDNDGDTLADFPADPGCKSATDASELFDCVDGLDNDGDGKIDYGTGPANDPGCQHELSFAKEDPQCLNGLDDDNDGLVDFPADTKCLNAGDDDELSNPPTGGCGLLGIELLPLVAWARARRRKSDGRAQCAR